MLLPHSTHSGPNFVNLIFDKNGLRTSKARAFFMLINPPRGINLVLIAALLAFVF